LDENNMKKTLNDYLAPSPTRRFLSGTDPTLSLAPPNWQINPFGWYHPASTPAKSAA